MLIATLKEDWHMNLTNLTEDAHKVLSNVDKIWFYGSESIIEAKETIEAEGHYVYLPPMWCDDFDDNLEVLCGFCELIRDLQVRAYPLTVEESDIENYTFITVSDEAYEVFSNVDYTNIRINDIPTIRQLTRMIYN